MNTSSIFAIQHGELPKDHNPPIADDKLATATKSGKSK